ncbi:MAG: PilX N-terminal domain-containing pilus assembly protein [Sedimenticola sp.]
MCSHSLPRQQPSTKYLHGKYQGGAVLATSMIMLVVMTLIGITALNSTKLEQRMAGNFQSQNRAFETAETGVVATSLGIPDIGSYNGSLTKVGSDYKGVATVQRDFVNFRKLQRQQDVVSSAIRFRRALFEVESEGEVQNSASDVLARTTVHGGFYLVVPDPTAK